MKIFRILLTCIVLLFTYACSHPIEIVGEGDVWSTGGRTCTLEDYQSELANCSTNYVIEQYQDTYYAKPREGWQFDHWDNYCTELLGEGCSFDIPAAVVREAWGTTAPPLRAVFNEVFTPTGFFRVEQGASRWWLVDPQGMPFYSVGLNHISSGGYRDAQTGLALVAGRPPGHALLLSRIESYKQRRLPRRADRPLPLL